MLRGLSLGAFVLAAGAAGLFLGWTPSLAEDPPTAPDVPLDTALDDTEPWSRLLGRYVTPDRRFDYAALAGNGDDRRALREWLARAARVQVSLLPRNARMAYWINLYNAATVELILRHYPLDSILKIGLIPGNAWKRDFVRAGGRLLSLDHIEHEILRKDFEDPRIHFAINCASISCPPLRREAYRGSALDRQLDEATREFLDSLAGLRHEVRGDELVLRVSKIFDWFREDFEAYPSGVLGFLRDHAPPEVGRLMLRHLGRIDVRYQDYDWGLNEPPSL